MFAGVNVSAAVPKATSSPLRKMTSSKSCSTVRRSWWLTMTSFPSSAASRRSRSLKNLLGVTVQAGKRLVEQVNVGALRDGPREKSALLLSAAQGADLPAGQVSQVRGVQGGVDRGRVLGAEAPPAAQGGENAPSPPSPRTVSGKIPVHEAALRQIGDGLIGTRRAVLVGVEDDAAGLERCEPRDGFEQRRFARAVRPEQADAAAAVQLQVDVVQCRHAAVGDGEVFDDEPVRSHAIEARLRLERSEFRGNRCTMGAAPVAAVYDRRSAASAKQRPAAVIDRCYSRVSIAMI